MATVWTVPTGYATPASAYPKATRGTARIVKGYMKGAYEMCGVRNAKYYAFQKRWTLTVLQTFEAFDGSLARPVVKPTWRTWMVDDPLHWEGMQEYVESIRPGRVLVGGLGLGLIVHALRARPDVTDVVVMERNADVIALIEPLLLPPPPGQVVTVVHGDFWAALEEVPVGAYSTVFVDLWRGEGAAVWPDVDLGRRHVEAHLPWPATESLFFGFQPRIDLLRGAEEAWRRIPPAVVKQMLDEAQRRVTEATEQRS